MLQSTLFCSIVFFVLSLLCIFLSLIVIAADKTLLKDSFYLFIDLNLTYLSIANIYSIIATNFFQ